MKKNIEKDLKRPVFFIAEIGVNHNGNIELAHKLIDEAASVGASSVKFQTFIAKEGISKYSQLANYQNSNTVSAINQLELVRDYELSAEDFVNIKKH